MHKESRHVLILGACASGLFCAGRRPPSDTLASSS